MRRPGAQYTRVVLPESVVRRVRAALENSPDQEHPDPEEPPGCQDLSAFREALVSQEPAHPSEPGDRREPADLPKPPDSQGAAAFEEAAHPREPAAFQEAPEPAARGTGDTTPPSPWFPISPEDDTQQFPAIRAPAASDAETPVRDVISMPPKRDARRRVTTPTKRMPNAGTPASGTAPHRPAVAATTSARASGEGSRPAAAPKVSAARRYRMAAVLISVVVLVATASVAFAVSLHGAGGNHHTPAPAAQTIRNSVASWVVSQVSASAIVSCDPAMCQALKARGIPATRLLTLRSGRADPLRSVIIVATDVVRSEFGMRLVSVYAPAVIASFGSGTLRIDIRAIARHGAAAYMSAMSADMLTRKSAGLTLAGSQLITTSTAARAQLSEGKVDWRLLFTIAELAGIHPVSILAFGDSGPGASPGMPLRSADLAEATSRAGTANPAYIRSMVNFLHAQHGTYAPAHIQTVRLASGRAALRIEFAAPSPVDILNPSELP